MIAYLLRRLLLVPPTLFGIAAACFFMTQALPGGPVEQQISKMRTVADGAKAGAEKWISPEVVAQLNAYYGFDKPIWERFVDWLIKLAHGDLGTSWTYGEPVLQVILDRMPISLFFGLSAFVVSWATCVPLAVWKARRNGSWADALSSGALFGAYVLPGYALGVLLLILLAGGSYWDIFPLGGIVSEDFEDLGLWMGLWDFALHMALPLTCMLLGEFAVLTFLIKNSLLDEMNKDYVRAALARGASGARAVWVHALRNTLVPLTNRIGELFTVMFAGSMLIEKVFDIDGMGLLFYNAMHGRDYPVVMGIVLLSSAMALLGRVFADLCMAWLDPRIQLGDENKK